MTSVLAITASLAFNAQGCSAADESAALPDVVAADVAADDANASDDSGLGDVPLATGDMTVPDIAPVDDSEAADTADVAEPPKAPAPLSVGVGRVKMPVPVGLGTAGFGQLNFGGGGEKSRYADAYAASTKVYTHPSFHAIALQAGADTVVFLRLDLVGVTQEARQSVVKRVIERGGPDLKDGLVMAATHTHSGPGRLVDIELWGAITDSFFPEFYVRMVDGMADAVLAAVSDLAPARWGHTVLETDDLHTDRRCQNPELLDGRLPVFRFDDVKSGKTKAVLSFYAVHGTVVGSDSGTLTRDFHGAAELKIEEQFDSPVTALFFNSWSGDMRPRTVDVPSAVAIPGDYNKLEEAGNRAADVVVKGIVGLEMKDEIVLDAAMTRIPLGLDKLGYGEGDFAWEYGAVYCGGGIDAACYGEGEPPPDYALVSGCVPFDKNSPAPLDTIVGVVRVGDSWMLTTPGEPVTELGTRMVKDVAEQNGLAPAQVHLVGYAQDYIGYSLSEEDWFHGGYEASGSLWGPKQGEYLHARTTAWAAHVISGQAADADLLPPREPKAYEVAPWVVDDAEPASVAVQPLAEVTRGDIVEVAIDGGDPWLLAPDVTLLKKDGETWTPVLRKNGTPISTDGYEFETALKVTPAYGDVKSPVKRRFTWTFRFPTARPVPSTSPVLDGTYAFEFRGLIASGTTYSLQSAAFVVKAP